jgi:hypothetical protein
MQDRVFRIYETILRDDPRALAASQDPLQRAALRFLFALIAGSDDRQAPYAAKFAFPGVLGFLLPGTTPSSAAQFALCVGGMR